MGATSKSGPDSRKAKPRPPRKAAPGEGPNSTPESGSQPREQGGAEHEPAQREALLRAIFETEPECVKVLDREGILVEMNRAGLDMIEADSLDQMRGQCIFSLVTPEHRARFQELTERVFQGESGTLEFEVVGLKGAHRWLETQAVPLRDKSGAVTKLLGITRDITERKQAEDALHESRRMLSALIGNLPGLAYRCRNDRDWTMEFVSDGCFELTGYRPADFIANRIISFGQLIHPDDQEPARREVEASLHENRRFRCVYRITTRSGEQKWIWEQGGAVFYGGQRGQEILEGFMIDITERKRGERLQSALYRIGEVARSAEDLQTLYASIHTILGELMYAKNCYIALYDAAFQTISFPYFVDELDEPFTKPRPLGKGLTEYVLRTGQPLLATPEVFEEMVRQGEVELIGAPSTDWMGVPLKQGDSTFGVLVLQTYEPNVRYGEKEKEILTFVSQQIASAIEQRHSQEALRESEGRFREIAESSAALFTIFDGQHFVFANQAAKAITGYTPEELAGMNPFDLAHPRFREEARRIAAARLSDQDTPVRYELPILTKGGEER